MIASSFFILDNEDKKYEKNNLKKHCKNRKVHSRTGRWMADILGISRNNARFLSKRAVEKSER